MSIRSIKIDSVCIFSNLYPPIVSGSSTQSSGLARELASRGIEVSVITSKIDEKMPEYERSEDVHVYRLPSKIMPRMEIALNFPWLNYTYTLNNQKRIDDIIKRHRPKILHLHNHMFDLSFSATKFRNRYKIPLVVTIHTVIKHSRQFYNLILYPADRIFLRKTVIDKTDLIICPDYNVRRYVEEAFKAKNHILIPYGIDQLKPPMPEKINRIEEKYELKEKNIILSLGHVHELRNRIDLIEAMPKVLKNVPNAILLIVGEVTTDLPGKLVSSLGIQKSVVFTGAVPHDDISAYFSLAKVEAHWLNQDDPEETSLGIASLESMSFGKPIIAVANVDTYGEGVLKNGQNCVIAKHSNSDYLANIITELLDDEEKRKMIGNNAYKTIQEYFTWGSICRQTLKAYELACDTLK